MMSKHKIAMFLGCSVGLIIYAKLALYYEKNCKAPRQYSTKKFVKPENNKQETVNKTIRNGFTKKKIPKNIDAIIIGSGISGLTVGALLSLIGKRVLVLEQHYIAGGCTHSFQEKGVEFDTGIHYVGNMGKNSKSTTKKVFDLITNNKVKWYQMGSELTENKNCYDEIIIGDKKYNLRAGKEEWLNEIKKHFEKEQVKEAANFLNEEILKSKKYLDDYFESKVIKYKSLQTLYLKLFCSKFFDGLKENSVELVERYTKNKDLQHLLLALTNDVCTNPNVLPGLFLSNVLHHYLNGGYYPNGGCKQIAYNIINTIKQCGGQVLVRKKVKQILIDPITKKKVIGVEMENGIKIYSNIVVSACGIFNTYNHLIKENQSDKILSKHVNSMRNKIKNIGHSGTFLYVFVGLNGCAKELGLRSSNIWSHPHGNYYESMKEFYADPTKAAITLFMGFPCAKDAEWNQRYPGKSSAVILTMCNYKEFEHWKNLKSGKRGYDYNIKKDMYCKRILEEGLYKYYPSTIGRAEFTAIGTPLTFNHFIGSNVGEVYGLQLIQQRYLSNDFLRSDNITKYINGMYITGQDITMPGFSAALMAGVITTHNILGYGGVIDLLSGRNLINDINQINNI